MGFIWGFWYTFLKARQKRKPAICFISTVAQCPAAWCESRHESVAHLSTIFILKDHKTGLFSKLSNTVWFASIDPVSKTSLEVLFL